MMIHEFAALVGFEPSPECWERIEYVYMNDDSFNTKADIADFYKKYDMNGIEKRYQALMHKEEEKLAGGHHFLLSIPTTNYEFTFSSSNIFEILLALNEASVSFGFEFNKIEAMRSLVALEDGSLLSCITSIYRIYRKAGVL